MSLLVEKYRRCISFQMLVRLSELALGNVGPRSPELGSLLPVRVVDNHCINNPILAHPDDDGFLSPTRGDTLL